MLAYCFLFLLPVYQTIASLRYSAQPLQSHRWATKWRLMFVFITLMVGFRHEVGGDWFPYLEHLNAAKGELFLEAFDHGEIAYSLLNWIAAQSGLGVYLVNIVFALLFTWGLLTFCRNQPRSWLALVVAVPYLVTVVAMGYSRQGVAIGLVMLGLVALQQKSVYRFVICVGIAAMFHKSAVILIPLAALSVSKRPALTILLVFVTSVLLFVLLLQEYFAGLMAGYIFAEYESTGAAIRVAMNSLPASVFLLLRKRFALEAHQRSFWTWMAWFALAFIVLLYASPSSTAVDRLALYLIPLQLFVWSRLPDALDHTGKLKSFWVYAVIFYSATAHFVWLFFATHSYLWLPYQFYPLVWLWG